MIEGYCHNKRFADRYAQHQAENYLYDGKGNVMAVIDNTESVVATYRYDAFGVLKKKAGTLDQPYRFSTKRYDEERGLSYYGYRFYSPVLGRWITRDPLGEAGGINLYGFVGNCPVNFVDPWGLGSIDIGFTGGTGRAGVNVGVKIGSSGVYGYYGFGLGGGFGASASVSTETPSPGVSVTGIARAGTGTWGGYGSVGIDTAGNVSPNIGIGWGIGWGWNMGATHTFGYSFDHGWDWGLGNGEKEPCL